MSHKTTFVSFLLDETGSMQSIKDDTVGGFNAYVEKLRGGGDDIVFSLVSFNSSETRRRCVAEPITDIAPLSEDDYEPKAMTPLIDAAVKIIRATAEAVEHRRDDPNVVVVMQTDGRENVSVEYTRADLAELVKEKEKAGWQFVFLGAGLDAFDAARTAGVDIHPGQVMSYGRELSAPAFDSVAENVSAFAKSGDAHSLRFSREQREDAGDVHTDRHLDREDGRSPSSRKNGRGSRAGRSSTADDYSLS